MTSSWPTCCCATADGRHDAAPVLTDLHVHLRSDGLHPSRASLEMAPGAGRPVALPSAAHAPEDVGRDGRSR